MDSLTSRVDALEKAVRDGVQGKYRRVDGKTVFIRSTDEKVTKGPDRLKGKKMVMKDAGIVSTDGLKQQLGSPSAEVILTEKPNLKECGCEKGKPCRHDVEKKSCECVEKGSCGCKPVVNSLEGRLSKLADGLSLMVEKNKAH